MSKRTEQMSEVLRRAVQSVINEGFGDPRLQECVVTVSRVTVDAALKEAIVYVGVLPEERESRAIHGLQSAARHIRRKAGEKVSVKRMPDVAFRIDTRAKRQAGVLAALALVREELESSDGAGAGTDHGNGPDAVPGGGGAGGVDGAGTDTSGAGAEGEASR